MRVLNWKTFLVTLVFSVAPLGAAHAQTPAGGAASGSAGVSSAPRLENAKLETQAVSGSLSATVTQLVAQTSSPRWVGYAIPQVPGKRTMCCGNSWGNDGQICGPCHLEKENSGQVNFSSKNDPVIKLEGPREVLILLRLEDKNISRIRLVSEECTLDAGGLSLIWLSGVQPAESVQFLSAHVRGYDLDRHDIADGALTGIAMTADPAADRALSSFSAADQPEQLRKQTVFWMGEARGLAGFAALQKLEKTETDPEIRSQITFALSISPVPEALNEMIRMAHDDPDGHVRGQALFWLGQKAGKKAVAALDNAIANDPDTEVKKKAVFAISQLPKEDGVPKLIEVAQNNRNPEVRKQAMFWLGQSNDPRALQFFEKILAQ